MGSLDAIVTLGACPAGLASGGGALKSGPVLPIHISRRAKMRRAVFDSFGGCFRFDAEAQARCPRHYFESEGAKSQARTDNCFWVTPGVNVVFFLRQSDFKKCGPV